VIWLTGDQHFWHTNVIKYCNRPFSSVDEMDEALIDAWNKYVKHDDTVYHLGDFTLGNRLIAEKYFRRLNGNIGVLEYPWHHDKRWLDNEYFSAGGNIVHIEAPIVVLEGVEQIEGRGVPAILCHYAFEVWDRKHYGSLHFHAHSHGMLPKIQNRLDVSVDNAYKLTGEYRPLSLEEACKFAREAQ